MFGGLGSGVECDKSLFGQQSVTEIELEYPFALDHFIALVQGIDIHIIGWLQRAFARLVTRLVHDFVLEDSDQPGADRGPAIDRA